MKQRQTGTGKVIHKGTRKLFKYWNEVRGEFAAPQRTQISPAAIAPVLSATFILEKQDRREDFEFRLAGTAICAMFTAELKSRPFGLLFRGEDRKLIRNTLEACRNDSLCILLECQGENADGDKVHCETILLPLADRTPRILGSMQTLEIPYWLGARRVISFSITSLRVLDPAVDLIDLKNRPSVPIPLQRPYGLGGAAPLMVLDGEGSASTGKRGKLSIVRDDRTNR